MLKGISDPYVRNWVNYAKTSYVVPKHIDYSNRVLMITDLVKQSRLLEGQMELKEE